MAILYIFKKSLLEAKKYSLQYIVYISGISIYVVFYDSVSYYYYHFEKALHNLEFCCHMAGTVMMGEH